MDITSNKLHTRRNILAAAKMPSKAGEECCHTYRTINFKLCAIYSSIWTIPYMEKSTCITKGNWNLCHDQLQKRRQAKQRTSSLKGTLLLLNEMIQHQNDRKSSRTVINCTKTQNNVKKKDSYLNGDM